MARKKGAIMRLNIPIPEFCRDRGFVRCSGCGFEIRGDQCFDREFLAWIDRNKLRVQNKRKRSVEG